MNSPRDGHAFASISQWHAPVVMVVSLLIGTALATGHHAFYASLAGSPVSSDPIRVVGWTTTQQQINIALGTAFAFVVKASLILACSTVYMQLLFRAINRKSFKLSTLDNWFSGLNDLWSLGCLASYWRYPLLTLVAFTCWLLPIAAIISPASLSVVFDQVSPPPMQSVIVPQPAIDSMALASYDFKTLNDVQRISYGGPSDEVTRIAYAAAAAGRVLSIEPPGANASWVLEFTAPRYDCRDMEPEVVDLLMHNLIDLFNDLTSNNATPIGSWYEQTIIMFNYLSWSTIANDSSPVPFKQTTSTTSWVLQIQEGSYFKETGVDLFVAIVPRSHTVGSAVREADFPLDFRSPREGEQAIAEDKLTLMKWFFETATLTRCKPVPTTYQVNFSYSGSQDQHIQVLSAADAVDFHTYHSLLSANVSKEGTLVFQGDTETGAQNITSWASTIFRLGSYAALQAATNALILGASNSGSSKGHAYISQNEFRRADMSWSTQVFSTMLATTEEMQPLNEGVSTAYNITLQESGPAFDQAQSLLPNTANRSATQFNRVLEEMFFNITLSMASSKALTYNETSPLAPPRTDVIYHVFGNVYSYGSDKLWLAYGTAIGVTLLNVLVGLWAIVQTGASFTGNFSTIVRVAKNAVIEEDMREDRLPGRDPLPKRLAKAEIRLVEGEGLLGSKHSDSQESIQHIHHVIGYAPPRSDSRGWKP